MKTINQIISEFGEPPLCKCGCEIRYKILTYKYSTYRKNGGYPKFHKGHQNKGKVHSEKQNVEFGQHMSEIMSGEGHWNYNPKLHKTIEEIILELGEIPYCECGCGLKVNIYSKYYTKYKTQGYPKFIPEHTCRGKFNPAWNGGTSFGIYCPKFNFQKKEEIRNKYNRCCIICNKPETQNLTRKGKQLKLDVHHIDYNKEQGCENHQWRLVPLCKSCHSKTSHNNSRYIWENKICEILTKIDNKNNME